MGVRWSKTKAGDEVKKSLFDYVVNDIEGKAKALSGYRGSKCLLVANIASKCGLTERHYKELVSIRKEMREKYPEGKFEILGFPCAQFMNQEYHDAEKIKEFVAKYNVDFPLFELTKVNGNDATPVFQFLKYNSDALCDRSKEPITLGAIGWNFGKFLVDENGYVVNYYGPKVWPITFKDDIEAVLKGEKKGVYHEPPTSIVDKGCAQVGDGEACTRA